MTEKALESKVAKLAKRVKKLELEFAELHAKANHILDTIKPAITELRDLVRSLKDDMGPSFLQDPSPPSETESSEEDKEEKIEGLTRAQWDHLFDIYLHYRESDQHPNIPTETGEPGANDS